MQEEKSSSSMGRARPSGATSSIPIGAPSNGISAVEARLSAQVAAAAALAGGAAGSEFGSGIAQPAAHLPSSAGTTNLRSSTTSTLSGNSGVGSSGGVEMNPLDWADVQFKRAGVGHTPIANLGMQQRVRHAQLFGVVEKLRDGQQHIFLDQFNQFPNVESHTADDYSKIWHAFKAKDEEAQHIIAKLNGLCDNIDTLNRIANNPHG